MKPSFLAPVVALLLLLGAWEGAVWLLQIPLFLLPPPSAVAGALTHDPHALGQALVTTARAALLGFMGSALFGVSSAIVLSTSRLLERALYPYAVFLQTVPIVAIAPLLVIWFGPGLRAVTVSALIVSIFPVIANTLAGIRAVDPALRDLFQLYGASRLATLFKLELPAALPQIFTGLRVAAGLAVIGTIVGEFVAGFAEDDAGLGIKILAAARQSRTEQIFAAVVLAALLGLGLFSVVGALGSRLLRRWHAAERSAS
ncbi:MAG TPA: ABC transporter permease [Polyangiaceae bacterium]|jgi:NitT/TauT family transport system permease protein|nr:ABC transporter permease [Polyangiaceae bacterium]